jgi:hypothetical protein
MNLLAVFFLILSLFSIAFSTEIEHREISTRTFTEKSNVLWDRILNLVGNKAATISLKFNGREILVSGDQYGFRVRPKDEKDQEFHGQERLDILYALYEYLAEKKIETPALPPEQTSVPIPKPSEHEVVEVKKTEPETEGQATAPGEKVATEKEGILKAEEPILSEPEHATMKEETQPHEGEAPKVELIITIKKG